jgi:hypothetical protein
MATRDYIDHCSNKNRCAHQHSEAKPNTHEVFCPTQSIEVTLDSGSPRLRHKSSIELPSEVIAVIFSLLQSECILANLAQQWAIASVARQGKYRPTFFVN